MISTRAVSVILAVAIGAFYPFPAHSFITSFSSSIAPHPTRRPGNESRLRRKPALVAPPHPTRSSAKVDADSEGEDFFFVRDAAFADLGSVARILTDGFYGDVNLITYQIERLNTFLSLESTFPTPADAESHVMAVACRSTDGKVLGFAELDCRPSKDAMAPPRPYMCNLAVDKKWTRRGIARALIKECEERALRRGGGDRMFLKVRERNEAATLLYQGVGYQVEAQSHEAIRGKPPDLVLLLGKDLQCADPESNLVQMKEREEAVVGV